MAGWFYKGIAILGLALLMVVHEAGHFFAARAFGMRVMRFSIGFGPTFFRIEPRDGRYWFTTAGGRVNVKLWKHIPEKHGPTIYQVAMIPFLAFVQIAGMNPLEEVDEKDKGSYANASLLGRVITIFGGPFLNYAFASVLFFASFYIGGKPVRSTEINVLEGKPAAMAGVKNGDKIVGVDGTAVADWDEMAELISARASKDTEIVVERGTEKVTLHVTPAPDPKGDGKIGVAAVAAAKRVPLSVGGAAKLAITTPPHVVKDLLTGLAQWVTGKAEGEFAGPARIVDEVGKAAQRGWADALFLLGAISAYLGAFNLLPVPPLDGGRLLFLLYEGLTRRRASGKVEAQVLAVGVVMMVSLMAWVVISDIRFFASAK
jgi:regulator of sigma E protease